MHNGRSRINHEEPQIRDDGTMLWVRTSKIPLRDETGTIVGVFGTYEDITDYKQAQIAVADSEAKFRRLVEDAATIFLPSRRRVCLPTSHPSSRRYLAMTSCFLR
jgi:PAS domain-containing protein